MSVLHNLSINLKTSSNWSGLRGKLVTTRQIPQLERAGHFTQSLRPLRSGRYACRYAGRYSYFSRDGRNMNKRTASKIRYFHIGNFSTHWKPWMILMSDPKYFYDNAKEAVIRTCFPLVCASENNKVHQSVSRLKLKYF